MAKPLKKYLCYSDTHLNFTFPWTQYDFAERILNERPAGLFLVGDIACGITLPHMLTFLAKRLRDIPIYFVIGNHDHYSYSIARTTTVLQQLCREHTNLVWLTDQNIVPLSDEIALIGEDGWYDGRIGQTDYLNYNLDWIMIDEFRRLASFDAKLSLCRQLADQYTANLKTKLDEALNTYQTVYILTHMPGWKEAVRGLGSETEAFWLPYNINYHMGLMIEEVMADRDDQHVVVLSGHTHQPSMLNVSHNIECIVQRGKYLGEPTEHNCVFI